MIAFPVIFQGRAVQQAAFNACVGCSIAEVKYLLDKAVSGTRSALMTTDNECGCIYNSNCCSLLPLLANDLFAGAKFLTVLLTTSTHHHNRYMALFPGPPGWAGTRREPLDFVVQGKINRGRHTDHPAGRHSIQTKQCLPPPSPIFLTGRMPFLPPNQQCQSTEGN